MSREETRAKRVAGISVLGALVIVSDYIMKFSGLKMPFPWLPMLKFDFTGIPIFLSLLLYGLPSGAATSAVAFLAIVVRSGKPVEASIKAIAELSTVLGAAAFIHKSDLSWKVLSTTCSLGSRVALMSLVNMIVLPSYYQLPFALALSWLPLIGIFNIMHGALSFFGGYALYEVLRARVPSLVPREESKKTSKIIDQSSRTRLR